jgi:hypothetical protein
MKWANSYYDKEKATAVLDAYRDKDREFYYKPPGIDKNSAKMYQHERTTYVDNLIKAEKNKYVQYPEKQDIIDEIVSKIKEEEEEKQKKSYVDVMKEKYKAKGGSLTRCDRITIVSEAEHVGEKLPFYNSVPEEEEEEQPNDEDDKKKKKQKKLFYPDVKL